MGDINTDLTEKGTAVQTEFFWGKTGLMAGYCEHGDELSFSIKAGYFLAS